MSTDTTRPWLKVRPNSGPRPRAEPGRCNCSGTSLKGYRHHWRSGRWQDHNRQKLLKALQGRALHICNLYNLNRTRSEVIGHFRAADHWRAGMVKHYVAPGMDGPVVIEREDQRISGLMAWGVPNAGKLVTNVRNLESPFWRGMLEAPHHRCLVPATEFEEWSATPDPGMGKKRAHWFSIPSRPLFAFAGIWRKVDGQPRYAFLTTEPNALIGAVHPKAMPVILDEADYDRWLTAEWEDVGRLVAAYPSQLMAGSHSA